jgi:hypothetical protein
MFAETVNERENAFIAAHTWQNPYGCQENALTLALHMCQIRLSRGGSLFQVFQVFQQGKGKPCPYILATRGCKGGAGSGEAVFQVFQVC